MTKIKVIANQSVFDVAVQAMGNVDAAFDLAYANEISVTSELLPGQELIIPDSAFSNQEVSAYYTGKNKKIATHILLPFEGDLSPVQEGIGYMIIADTFIVR